MPFTKGQPEDLSNLRDMAYGWGKIPSAESWCAKIRGIHKIG